MINNKLICFNFIGLLLRIICLVFTIGGISKLYAQNIQAISKLKWEDAEMNYVKGNFNKALQLVKETENLIGTTSPKTLYLKILIQDTLFQLDRKNRMPTFYEVDSIRINVKYYIDNFYTVSEEKYRTIYEVSEKYKIYPETLVEFEKYRRNKLNEWNVYLSLLKHYKDSLTYERNLRTSKAYRDSVLLRNRTRRFIWSLTTIYGASRILKGIRNWIDNRSFFRKNHDDLDIVLMVIPSVYVYSSGLGLLDNHRSKEMKNSILKEIEMLDELLVDIESDIVRAQTYLRNTKS